MSQLTELHADINARVLSIRENNADWLCGKGCDSCCKRLAEVPQLTAAEWDLLREVLAGLAADYLQAISREIAALAGSAERPVICPLLDHATGACPVYVHRPVACRSYGFYMQRGLGLFCHDIEKQVADGKLQNVVWGNHDAIDHRLAGLGESRPLTDWFADWERESRATSR
ncbi:MAG: YkgJ family cysteine cluster protein [Gammaproteobacteria bacterium]|nr:YkgJ family cysteine cluster protein [Gammaproteobacteria bacterium]MBU1601712.1 YkgJ family cysteine cluster protein [Gammaproteobacteria bacterium]MBU2432084.1 YkgJ family cysteine cluster protein [Gammaproteobacteria bacterium]MBU2450523.1 YkgJ family cysteine cluster protein [Gammaproteobacteria bacterium]